MSTPDSVRLTVAATQPAAPAADARDGQLELLNEVARIATLDLELRPMLQRITDVLAGHFDWQVVALVVTDSEAGTVTCEAVTSRVPTSLYAGYSRPLGSGVVGHVASTHEAVLVDDVRNHAGFVDTTPGVLSEICAPIKHNGELVAVLNIESTRLAAFTGQLPLLQTIADQIAGAIASARRFEELEQRARLMQMMSDVSRTSLAASTLDDFLHRVAAYVHEQFPLEIVSIRLYDTARNEYVRAADAGTIGSHAGTDRWPASDGIIGRCIRTGKTQLVRDVEADPEYIRTDASVKAELVVPIVFRDELLGVFNLESRSADVFTTANVQAFEAFAHQIAGAVRLFRTHDELTTAKSDLEQERRNLQAANAQLTGLVEKFEKMSAHDSLTGLHNRHHFETIFPVEWRRAARARAPLSLLIADIDAFKDYNDAHGHRAGDECLKRVAAAIRDTVHRAGDVVVRYGGEEFAILLPHTDRDNARKVAENIRQRIYALAIEHPTPAVADRMTISIGVASRIPDGDEKHAQALVDSADKALYRAKRAGRNRVVCSD